MMLNSSGREAGLTPTYSSAQPIAYQNIIVPSVTVTEGDMTLFHPHRAENHEVSMISSDLIIGINQGLGHSGLGRLVPL